MLPLDGPVVAPPDIRAQDWVHALPPESLPFALAPATESGWFRGQELVAWAPRSMRSGLTLSQVADTLAACMSGVSPGLAVALLPYTGVTFSAVYPGGVIRTAEGWRAWGSADTEEIQAPDCSTSTALPPDESLITDPLSDMTEFEFRERVRSVIEAIRSGDVYVLNLTRRIVGRSSTTPSIAFASLLARSAAEMGAYWATPDATIVSASPERFMRIADESVTVSPIKGTRPRRQGRADREMIGDLLKSEKERAEHVMIVDLVRNDLGRVCCAGSIGVDPLFGVVTTPYCHQMVSSVTGTLPSSVSLSAVLESTFPCGSVTGAPKIAAMRAIDALEKSSRSAYTGSLLVAVPGELDSSILIRTAEYSDGAVTWGTGGGITADSDAREEWLETELKAEPFLGRQQAQ